MCYAPGTELFWEGGGAENSASEVNIYAPLLKMESAAIEKNPGHASV